MGWREQIIRSYYAPRLRKIDHFCRFPHAVQQQQLSYLMKSVAATSFGREHHLTAQTNYEAFRALIPIRSYDELKPYIDRIRQGETSVLWNAPTRRMARSSGTTADRSKFIPITRQSLYDCHYRAGQDVMAIYLHLHPQSRLLSGKTLILGGSSTLDVYDGRLTVGDLSAILIHATPKPLVYLKAPEPEIALIPDFEEKVRRICETTVGANITGFAGVPSWNLVLMKRVLEYTGKSSLTDVWPNLEVFVHGGVSFEPYREQYRQIISSSQMNYMETYNASEGFFAIQDDPTTNDMLLMLDYRIFYEFIPTASLDDPATAVPLEGVKVGENYAMVISTNGGLWRYLIGDTVRFTSLAPYKIRITGRTKQFINAFGEELIVDNAECAIQAACRATDAIVAEYTAGPIYMTDREKGAHEWVIEFSRPPRDMAAFIDRLDEELQRANSDYEAKRYRNTTLERPVVHVVASGTFFHWMRSRNRLGGQHKVPRLANDRQYLDSKELRDNFLNFTNREQIK